MCKCVGSFLDGNAMVLACAFSDDGRWLLGGEDSGVIRVCDPVNLERAWDINGLSGPIVSLSMVRSVLAITNGADDVVIFDLQMQHTPPDLYDESAH
jgi:hypothetical protein